MADVRAEQPGDADAIRQVLELAFEGSVEADLVDLLRSSDAWLPSLSLVAEADSEIVGHILFSLVEVDGTPVLSLGPMGVTPGQQRSGVGTALVEHGLELARQSEHPLVVVLGHPEYYPRFGFTPARELEIGTPYEAPDEAWMALALPNYDGRLKGTVSYPPAWDAVG